MDKSSSNQPPLDLFLSQIHEMLELVQHPEKISSVDPDLAKKIEALKQVVGSLNDQIENSLRASGFNLDVLKEQFLASPAVTAKEKHFLEEAVFLQQKGMVVRKVIDQAMTANKKKTKTNQRHGKQGADVKERRKLFKSIGGDGKWIPL